MGVAIYIYENLNVYKEKYDNFVDPKLEENESSLKVLDLYIKDNDKLWIVVNTNKFSNKTGYTRSIAFFSLKEFDEYKKGDERLVLSDKLEYNPKNNHLQFYPKLLRKPELDIHTDKFNGEIPAKKSKIDSENMFFDLKFNRLILILKNEI